MKGEKHHFVQQNGKDNCWEAEMACWGGVIQLTYTCGRLGHRLCRCFFQYINRKSTTYIQKIPKYSNLVHFRNSGGQNGRQDQDEKDKSSLKFLPEICPPSSILLAIRFLQLTFSIPCKYLWAHLQSCPRTTEELWASYVGGNSARNTQKNIQLFLNQKSTSSAAFLSLRFLLFWLLKGILH